MTSKTNIMLDLETLGTKPGCIILSIAAVPFALSGCYELEPFYRKISDVSCGTYGMVSDKKTLDWWERQSDEARNEAFSGVEDLKLVLSDFSLYIAGMPTAPVIWGNGSDFDNPILAAAYELCDLPLPWSFRDNLCYRTLKNLYPVIPYVRPVIAHNALHDARAQATHAEHIFKWMNRKEIGNGELV